MLHALAMTALCAPCLIKLVHVVAGIIADPGSVALEGDDDGE